MFVGREFRLLRRVDDRVTERPRILLAALRILARFAMMTSARGSGTYSGARDRFEVRCGSWICATSSPTA